MRQQCAVFQKEAHATQRCTSQATASAAPALVCLMQHARHILFGQPNFCLWKQSTHSVGSKTSSRLRAAGCAESADEDEDEVEEDEEEEEEEEEEDEEEEGDGEEEEDASRGCSKFSSVVVSMAPSEMIGWRTEGTTGA